MSSNTLPLLTADDEPTARIPADALAGTIRASRPSLGMVAHAEPVLPVAVRKQAPLFTRLRHQLAAWLLGDAAWQERRVIAASIRQYKLERAWDRSDGVDPRPLRAWKESQLELEHATHALLVARGER